MIRMPDWQFVRSLGELQILTRASYLMLGLVPILAGIWTALTARIASSHYLPHSWVIAFLAALSVTIGQVLYQLRAPTVIKRFTLEDYERDAQRQYREQATEERLREADEQLAPDNPRVSPSRLRYLYPPSIRIAEFEEVVVRILEEQGEKFGADWVKDAYNYEGSHQLVIAKHKLWRQFGQYVAREGFYGLQNQRIYSTKQHVIDLPRQRLAQSANAFNEAGEAMRGGSAEPPESVDERRKADRLLHNVTKIGYAARKFYLLQAGSRRPEMLTASALYVLAIGLVLFITVDQTLSVLQAAGWLT